MVKLMIFKQNTICPIGTKSTVFTVSIRTLQPLTIYVLKFEPVQLLGTTEPGHYPMLCLKIAG